MWLKLSLRTLNRWIRLDEGEDETLESPELDDDSSETALFEVSDPEEDSGLLNSTDEAAVEPTSEAVETDDVLVESSDSDSFEDTEAQEQSVDEFNEVFDLVSDLLASEADDTVDLPLADGLPFVDVTDNAELPLPDVHPVEANEIESIEPLESSAAEPLDDSHSSPDDADIGEGEVQMSSTDWNRGCLSWMIPKRTVWILSSRMNLTVRNRMQVPCSTSPIWPPNLRSLKSLLKSPYLQSQTVKSQSNLCHSKTSHTLNPAGPVWPTVPRDNRQTMSLVPENGPKVAGPLLKLKRASAHHRFVNLRLTMAVQLGG